ncbi:MAG: regulatory protein GemA [Desulfuromonadaceae bacterium]
MSTTQRKSSQTFVKGRIAPSQIKAIHAVTNKLGLDDETYRHILHSRFNVDSCKDLTWRQAKELLESLNGEGKGGSRFKVQGSQSRTRKYTDLDGRPGFASGKQLRMLDALWSQVTRAEDEESKEKALNGFCHRIAGVAGLRMVKMYQVEKIVKALEAMGAVFKPANGQK